jgi:predicted double-glycine peptidase
MTPKLPMDEQLKSRFEQVLQHYADVLRERDDALLREKKAREQFEASFRAAVDNVIFPAAAQVKELVAPTNWICVATKSDNSLSASQSSGGSKQSVVKVEEITERIVQEYLFALVEKLVAEGPPR